MKELLWSIVWRKWLIGCYGEKLTVIKVKGWRTAIVQGVYTGRQTITPCFTIFGIEFL